MNIFFDLDGTLIDISERYYTVYKEAIREINQPHLAFKQYWLSKRNKIAESDILNIDVGNRKFELYEKRRIKLLEEEFFLNLDKPFPWVYKLLRELSQKHVLYVLTVRRNKENLNRELKRLRLVNFFATVLTAKPGTDPILAKEKLVKKIKLSVNDLLVGDTEVDILVAQKLGIKSIAVSSGIRTKKFLEKFEPDFLIKDGSEINASFEKMRQ